MFRFFMVGLGGSGGKTLQFLMERLRRELKHLGWEGDRLPECWQFVHLDTPKQSDGIGADLPDVVGARGEGRYVGFVNDGDLYGPVDRALTQRLVNARGLHLVHRWRPGPNDVPYTTDLTKGAAQMRAVGRVAGLVRAQEVFQALDDQHKLLITSKADGDLAQLTALVGGTPAANVDTQTLVFIVSSLAGGTGSSITMDVANYLRLLAAKEPWFGGAAQATAVLFTSQLFQRGNDAGVQPNSLAALTEIVNGLSSEQRPWTSEEWKIYGTIDPGSLIGNPGRGPLIVLPVGNQNSATGAILGDGSAETVYSGMASSLAALMLSEPQAQDYSSHFLGNWPTHLGGMGDQTEWTKQPLGVGALAGNVGFSGIGFASVDLGRDRYKEYAAQRIAGDCLIDLLLEGHRTPEVKADLRLEDKALKDITDQKYPQFLKQVGLPAHDPGLWHEVSASIWPAGQMEPLLKANVAAVFGDIQGGSGSDIATDIRNAISAQNPFVKGKGAAWSPAEENHRQAVEEWVGRVQTSIEAATVTVLAQVGIEVALRCVERFADDLERWAGSLHLAKSYFRSPADITGYTLKPLQGKDSKRGDGFIQGTLGPQSAQVQQAKTDYLKWMRQSMRADGSELDAGFIRDLKTSVVDRLVEGLRAARGEILRERISTANQPNTMETFEPSEWPRSDEASLKRFEAGANEFLLANVGDYPNLLKAHLAEARQLVTAAELTSLSPLRLASYRVLVAPEDTSDNPSAIDPGDTLGRNQGWQPRGLSALAATSTYRPFGSGSGEDRRCARWALDRARLYVERPNTGLHSYCSEGLLPYLDNCAINNPAELGAFVQAFQNALGAAAPLTKVSAAAVGAIHGTSVELRYSFSFMPLGTCWGQLQNELEQRLAAIGKLPPAEAHEILRKAARTDDKVQRVDVLTTYGKPYSPLVFSSLHEPIAARWAMCTNDASRYAFWTARRGRQLRDFVPVSSAWLQSFLIGWFIGRFTGEVRLPTTGAVVSVLADPDVGAWADFGVVVGVHDIEADQIMQGKKEKFGYDLDAIPVLLESLPLAWSLSAANTADVGQRRPYLAVKRLGDAVNQIGLAWAASPALDAWFAGTPRSGKGAMEGTRADRVADLRARVEQFRGYFAGLAQEPDLTERDFWEKPRHWELRHELLSAAETLLKHVFDPGYLDEDSGYSGLTVPKFQG